MQGVGSGIHSKNEECKLGRKGEKAEEEKTAAVEYKSIGIRNKHPSTSKELQSFILTGKKENDFDDIHEVIKTVHHLTSSILSFSFQNGETDPEKLLRYKKANCIGYANLYATVASQLFKEHSFMDWSASTHIGQLHFFGRNIHPQLNHPYWKDHDFVILENRKTGERIGVDPSLRDYLFIQKIRILEP